MSNTYQLTQQIHQQVHRIAEEKGIKFEIENYKYLYPKDKFSFKDQRTILDEDDNFYLSYRYNEEGYSPTPLIDSEKQIKQILVAVKNILGLNVDWSVIKRDLKLLQFVSISTDFSTFYLNEVNSKVYAFGKKSYLEGRIQALKESQAEALCQKWLDGLEPMFETNPDQVLGELLEILKGI